MLFKKYRTKSLKSQVSSILATDMLASPAYSCGWKSNTVWIAHLNNTPMCDSSLFKGQNIVKCVKNISLKNSLMVFQVFFATKQHYTSCDVYG